MSEENFMVRPQQIKEELALSYESVDLYDRYGRDIFAYVRLHQLSREDAEDVTLEVFVAALENDNLSALPDGERLAWLRRVAHNKLVDRYRHKIRHPLIAVEQVEQGLFDDEFRSPEQQALQRESYAELHEAIRGLPSLQQQVLKLRYSDELRFSEIAILLNKREDALRQLVSRTLAQLRTAFNLPRQKGRK